MLAMGIHGSDQGNLRIAPSVAGLMITTECMISELPKKDAPPCLIWVAWAAGYDVIPSSHQTARFLRAVF